MANCPNGQVWSFTQSKCLDEASYQAYLQQLTVTGQWNLVSQEQNQGAVPDVLGLNSALTKIGDDLKQSGLKILLIGVGLILIIIAVYSYATGQNIKVQLPGKA